MQNYNPTHNLEQLYDFSGAYLEAFIMRDTNENVSFSPTFKERNLDTFKPFSFKDKNFEKLLGNTKDEVISQLGLVYNDLHRDF